MALRSGAVRQTSIEGLVKKPKKMYNKCIVWQTPKRAVLCAFNSARSSIDFSRAAATDQIQKTLQYGCDLVGTLSPVWFHDQRRGVAVDAGHLAVQSHGGF